MIKSEIANAAMHRLYGGQDRPGNYHFAAFTIESLSLLLQEVGFVDIKRHLINQNGETFAQNWNFKLSAFKHSEDEWI
jgi:hypothetical protein